MSSKEFPSCAYDVCAEFDCEETMALALIATRNELERTRRALELAMTGLKNCKTRDHIGAVCRIPEYVDKILGQINTITKGDDNE